MEQKDYRDIPNKITKKLTKVVPAAVSTATSNLSSLSLEHNFKDVLRKARMKFGGQSDDGEEPKRVEEVDNLIVLDDDNKANDQASLGRLDGVDVKGNVKTKANVKGQLPYSSAKPHSKWHIPPPIPDIIDEPIKPVYATNYGQRPLIKKATQDSADDSCSKLAPITKHQLRTTASLHVDNRPVLLPDGATKPVPLPRKSLRPSSGVDQIGQEISSNRESRPQSQPDYVPVPLPRKKLSKPSSIASSAEHDLPSYSSLFDAALAVENPSASQRPASTSDSLAESSSDDECSICFANSKDHATIPCGHVYCENCAQQQLKTSGVCYTCKQDIIMVTKVYIN